MAYDAGALDMAIANLFGSSLFDGAIIAFDDLPFLAGPIVAHVSPPHAVTSLSVAKSTGVAIVGPLYRPRRRLFHSVGWATLSLFALYYSIATYSTCTSE
jgi:cation:H+ antiporter